MTDIFKSDALLYLAFITAGLVSIVNTLVEKLICIGGAVLILIIRSIVKKYLYKD